MLRDGAKPQRKSVVITFDDGHKDNVVATEILKEFGIPATIFIIANKLGQPGYLSQEDVRLILEKDNLNIGSHTLNEVYLPDASDEVLRQEIADSRKKLKDLFDRDINAFSYTSGGFNEAALREVQEAGYLCACTTNRGYDSGLNRFALRRIKITDRDTPFRLKAKLSGHYNIYRKLKKPY
jgi:peptidoglycan/xylan/chitin deacetylase (PgdA/CDA1 family)